MVRSGLPMTSPLLLLFIVESTFSICCTICICGGVNGGIAVVVRVRIMVLGCAACVFWSSFVIDELGKPHKRPPTGPKKPNMPRISWLGLP